MCVTFRGMLWLSRIVWSSAERQRGENKLELMSDIPSAHISLSSLLDISSHSSSEGSTNTHTHTHSVSISHHIIYLCLVFSVTDTKIIPLLSHISRKILRIAYNSLVFPAWLWTHTLTIRAAHVDDDFQRRLLCWQQCFGLSQLQSVSLKTHRHTQHHRSHCLGHLYTYSDG